MTTPLDLALEPFTLECRSMVEVRPLTPHTHTVCVWEPPPHSTHTHTEYAYGGHPYSFTGVYDVEPQRAVEVAPGLKFRESIYLGHTHLTDREVEELVLSVGKEFNGNDYHIFNK